MGICVIHIVEACFSEQAFITTFAKILRKDLRKAARLQRSPGRVARSAPMCTCAPSGSRSEVFAKVFANVFAKVKRSIVDIIEYSMV